MRFVLLVLAFVVVGCGGTASGIQLVDEQQTADAATPNLKAPTPTLDGGDADAFVVSNDAAPETDAGTDSASACEYTVALASSAGNDSCANVDPNPCPCGQGYLYDCDANKTTAPIGVVDCTTVTKGAQTLLCCPSQSVTRYKGSDGQCTVDFPKSFYSPLGTAPAGNCVQQSGKMWCCK